MSALTDYEAQLAHMILSEEAPLEEPDRQRWFMKKAHMLVEKKSWELGRPMRALVKTFGCQMNERDSEKLRGILESVGYELTEEGGRGFRVVQYMYRAGERQPESLWKTGISGRSEKEKSAYDHRTVRLHDAGG